jgi:hypothetical protein
MFEVNLSDERIDLSKARRVEPRTPMSHLSLSSSDLATPRRAVRDPVRGQGHEF